MADATIQPIVFIAYVMARKSFLSVSGQRQGGQAGHQGQTLKQAERCGQQGIQPLHYDDLPYRR